MDHDALTIVGPSVDLTKIEPLHQKTTLTFINYFITHTVDFLNKFSCVCEEKLSDISLRIQKIETTMNLLEAKLNIEGLENVKAVAPVQQQQTVAPSTTETAPAETPQQTPAVTQETEPSPATVPVPVENKVCQDERYVRFFKMLHVGIPVPAVQQKMMSENLDPKLLLTPDAPAPPQNQGAEEAGSDSEEDDISDFSD